MKRIFVFMFIFLFITAFAHFANNDFVLGITEFVIASALLITFEVKHGEN